MNNLLRSTLVILVLTNNLFANCELSWVAAVSGEQNWLHTETSYPNEHDILAAKVEFKEDNLITIHCPDRFSDRESICNSFKNIFMGKEKICPNLDIKTSNYFDDYEQKHYLIEIKNCQHENLSNNAIVFLDSENKKILIPKLYQMQKAENIDLSGNKDINELQLSDIVLDSYNNISVDMSSIKESKYTTYTFNDQSKLQVSESQIDVQLKNIKNACKEGCRDQERKIVLPLVLLKQTKWKLFATPRMDNCAGYSKIFQENYKQVKEADLKLEMPFGGLTNYHGYDFDLDGKVDVLGISTRSHLPDTVQYYDVRKNYLEILNSVCTGSGKACFPDAGC